MKNFWQNKALTELTTEEWESLCDGCGLCCLHKLEDDETGDVFYTRVACKLLDTELCHCKQYETRTQHVPDCLTLTANTIANYPWLPESCAYRLLFENRQLPAWHPLVSKNSASVHNAGISVAGKAISEADIHPDDTESFILHFEE
ncbi:MAG TPA: YcgN family cysteine cluster protein [Gammaproteobacteria bacterium]|nr:YcgN family cysteine cluster protein [Gammaproteobacteria bacterium]